MSSGARWFTGVINGSVFAVGRITTTGTVTVYQAGRLLLRDFIRSGPDGAVWLTNTNSIARITAADSVVTSPDQGPSGTTETVTGAGYNPGETVVVKYNTGLTSPASVSLCTTSAAPDGSFTCTASIASTAGHRGTHNRHRSRDSIEGLRRDHLPPHCPLTERPTAKQWTARTRSWGEMCVGPVADPGHFCW